MGRIITFSGASGPLDQNFFLQHVVAHFADKTGSVAVFDEKHYFGTQQKDINQRANRGEITRRRQAWELSGLRMPLWSKIILPASEFFQQTLCYRGALDSIIYQGGEGEDNEFATVESVVADHTFSLGRWKTAMPDVGVIFWASAEVIEEYQGGRKDKEKIGGGGTGNPKLEDAIATDARARALLANPAGLPCPIVGVENRGPAHFPAMLEELVAKLEAVSQSAP